MLTKVLIEMLQEGGWEIRFHNDTIKDIIEVEICKNHKSVIRCYDACGLIHKLTNCNDDYSQSYILANMLLNMMNAWNDQYGTLMPKK